MIELRSVVWETKRSVGRTDVPVCSSVVVAFCAVLAENTHGIVFACRVYFSDYTRWKFLNERSSCFLLQQSKQQKTVMLGGGYIRDIKPLLIVLDGKERFQSH
jgi:hypothetical protein